MLRERLSEALKEALKAKQARRVSTLRLILAALKDRDIAARTDGRNGTISDDDIMALLQTMVRQRRDSIQMYEQGNRQDLADQEKEEITIIESFLPQQLSDAEIQSAIRETLGEVGATAIKDMGKAMAALRAKYAGRMDFSKAGALVKQQLSGAA